MNSTLVMTAMLLRGHSFMSLNAELLQQYAACETGADVVNVQMQWLEHLRSRPAPEPDGE